MKICSLESCSRSRLALGLCQAHYYRFRKYGDVRESIAIGDNPLTPDELISKGNNISVARMGKSVGSDRPLWKGGVARRRVETEYAPYRRWRNAVLERDQYTCVACSQIGGKLHVDHIIDWTKSTELRYDVTNGQTLCLFCHYYKSFGKEMPVNSKWSQLTKAY